MQVAARCIDGTFEPVDSSELNLYVSVCAVVIRDGKILVIPMFGGYDFPGGGVEKGETHIAALRREVKEETGFDVEPDGLIDAYTTFFKSHKSGKFFHSLHMLYFAKIVGGGLSVGGRTEAEIKYMKSPRFVDIDYLKSKPFLRYIDDCPSLMQAIENRIAEQSENPAGQSPRSGAKTEGSAEKIEGAGTGERRAA
jgi:8-oxo-dGTP pyrophosphatase MutT (NUDIX family)